MGTLRCLVWLWTFQLFVFTVRGYMITTPRQWSHAERNHVCLTLSSPASSEDNLKIGIASVEDPKKFLLPITAFPLFEGEQSLCMNIALENASEPSGNLLVEGLLEGKPVNYSRPIAIAKDSATFIQTFKSGNDTIEFRILTLIGPYLRVSTEPYKKVWVETPSKKKIAEWSNVSNENGLEHLSFDLPEQLPGNYEIQVQGADNRITNHTFKVIGPKPPKFVVTLNCPTNVLEAVRVLDVEVCAKYPDNIDQIFEGKLNLSLAGKNITQKGYQTTIFGCKKISIDFQNMPFEESLVLKATVIENGTEQEIKADRRIHIKSESIYFQNVGSQMSVKTELPFIAKIAVKYYDGSPASNEIMEVCSGVVCKNIRTNSGGILRAYIPSDLSTNFQIKPKSYTKLWKEHPELKSQVGVYESNKTFHLKKYNSPSHSSLNIALEDELIDCDSASDDIEFNVPIWFVSNQQYKTLIGVQVLSRGLIQFSKTFERQLGRGSDIKINETLLLSPMGDLQQKGLVRGSFDLRIVLPKTISPEAQLLVWYRRDDGEIVADSRTLNVENCYANHVQLSWSPEETKGDDSVTLNLKSTPNSLCSLKVADEEDFSTSEKLSLISKNVMNFVSETDLDFKLYSQVNDTTYCMENGYAAKVHSENELIRGGIAIYYSNEFDAGKMFDNAGLHVLSDQSLEHRKCNFRAERDICKRRFLLRLCERTKRLKEAEAEKLKAESQKRKTSQTHAESVVPTSWIFDLVDLRDNGALERTLKLPKSSRKLAGSAVCVHPTRGVGISKIVSTTKRDFTVDIELPKLAIVGELTRIGVHVKNHLKTSLPIRVDLDRNKGTSNYELYSSSEETQDITKANHCVPANAQINLNYDVKPTVEGYVNIGVSVDTDVNACDDQGAKISKTQHVVKYLRVKNE